MIVKGPLAITRLVVALVTKVSRAVVSFWVVSLVKMGNGTQALTNANTYTGTTTVNGGTLLVDGSTSAASATWMGTIRRPTGAS